MLFIINALQSCKIPAMLWFNYGHPPKAIRGCASLPIGFQNITFGGAREQKTSAYVVSDVMLRVSRDLFDSLNDLGELISPVIGR